MDSGKEHINLVLISVPSQLCPDSLDQRLKFRAEYSASD
jgi:hypothetical protein